MAGRLRWPGSRWRCWSSLYQGGLTAVLGVPSFVVTLGGLMSFRGAAFLVADGKTQPVTDDFFLRLGGGYDGGIGVGRDVGAGRPWSASALFVRMLHEAPRAAAPRHAGASRCGWTLLLVAVPIVIVLSPSPRR